jgi:hypothetical protein
MPPLNNATEDGFSRQIRPIVYNTKPDGSGDWYMPSGGYSTPTHTAPSVAATTTEVLAANSSRLYGLLVNDSDEAIYIKIGTSAVMNEGIRLNPIGGSYEMSREIGNLNTAVINAICASGSKVLLVLEGI